MRAMPNRAVARALLALALALAPGARAEEPASPPTIYKWVDENGVAHYTIDKSRIPSAIRERVERAGKPDVAAPPHRDDLMRDAVRTRPTTPAPVAATPAATPPASAPAPLQASPVAPPTPSDAPVEPAPAPVAAVEPVPAAAPEAAPVEEIPPPLASDFPEPVDPVSAPPPAPVAALEPKQAAEMAKLDEQIAALESEIEKREERLAALISSSDEQRTTALVDDPAFREISQKLPKLQAELQSLRERRARIQPSAPTP
jgi:hypothetical protein